MKLGISNIAWKAPIEDEKNFHWAQNNGIEYIELCPTKIFPEFKFTDLSLKNYKIKVKNFGLKISAFQALFFSKPLWNLFDKNDQNLMFEHFKLLGEMAEGLGVKFLVFGSPKNKKRGDLDLNKSIDLAFDFFQKVGNILKPYNVILGLEPNPKKYDCDFFMETQEVFDFTRILNHTNVKLHMDTGGMIINQEDPVIIPDNILKSIRYFHLSAPQLDFPDKSELDFHKILAEKLNNVGYNGIISVEMLNKKNYPLDDLKPFLNIYKTL